MRFHKMKSWLTNNSHNNKVFFLHCVRLRKRYSVVMDPKRPVPSQKQEHGGKKKRTDEDLAPLDDPSIPGT